MADRYEAVELVPDATVAHLTTAVLLAALTAVFAQVSIPVPGIPVPFSLQPFGVFIAALVLGPLWGGFSMLVYLLVGIAGMPVFSSGGAGLGYVLGPTGGFLVGFVLGAALAGGLAHRAIEPRDLRTVPVALQAVALLVAVAAVYAVGVPWLATVQGIPIEAAATAMAPFVVPDLLKAGLTVALVAGGDEALARVA